MAWIVPLPPSARHPKPRWQVRYRDQQGTERSGGIYASQKEATRWKANLEKGKRPAAAPKRRRSRTTGAVPAPGAAPAARQDIHTFGDFVTHRWWEPWKELHPNSAPGLSYILNGRILPAFGDLALPRDNDEAIGEWSDAIGAWKANLIRQSLRPRTVNSYLTILAMIINAAVDVRLFARSPLTRPSGNGRIPALRNLETEAVDAWLTLPQLNRLADAIDNRYRALIILAGRTGLRFGECVALLWSDLALDTPHDDGAVAGPGRARIQWAISDPTRSGNGTKKRTKTRTGRRTIALDTDTVAALKHHRKHYGDDPDGRVFTTAGGSRGPGGTPSASNFNRVWERALQSSGLYDELPKKTVLRTFWRKLKNGTRKKVTEPVEVSVLSFHGLRHTHATHLIALGRPDNAVAARLGHKNVAFTMTVYAAVISLSDAGELKPKDLGLAA